MAGEKLIIKSAKEIAEVVGNKGADKASSVFKPLNPVKQDFTTSPNMTPVPKKQTMSTVSKAGLAGVGTIGAGAGAMQLMSEPTEPESVDAVEVPVAVPPEKQKEQDIINTYKSKLEQKGKPSAATGAYEPRLRRAVGIDYVPDTETVNVLLQKAKEAGKGLSTQQQEWYEGQLASVRSQAETLSREMKVKMTEVESDQEKVSMALAIGEGLEMLGHNLTRLFAANYGLKKGVDMSGLAFDKFDWQRTQARFDKRFEGIITRLQEDTQAKMKSLGQVEEGLVSARSKEEERLAKEAMDYTKMGLEYGQREAGRAMEAEKFSAGEKNAMARKEADLQMQAERNRIEMAKVEAMKARQEAAQALKESGKVDKAAALEFKNRQEAVNKIKANILANTEIGAETISPDEFSKVIKGSAEELSKADLNIEEILPGITSKGFLGFGAGKVNRQLFLQKLDELVQQPAADSTESIAPSNNIIYTESVDDIPSLVE